MSIVRCLSCQIRTVESETVNDDDSSVSALLIAMKLKLVVISLRMMLMVLLVLLVQPNVEELDKSVNEVKKVLTDAKLKSKLPGGVMGATPPTASCNATPEKSSNFSPLLRPDIRRLKSEDEKSDSSFGLVVSICLLYYNI